MKVGIVGLPVCLWSTSVPVSLLLVIDTFISTFIPLIRHWVSVTSLTHFLFSFSTTLSSSSELSSLPFELLYQFQMPPISLHPAQISGEISDIFLQFYKLCLCFLKSVFFLSYIWYGKWSIVHLENKATMNLPDIGGCWKTLVTWPVTFMLRNCSF